MGVKQNHLGFVFPGQGSQSLGMLNSFAAEPVILKTFEEASRAVDFDLWQLSQTGPVETINQTVNTQPLLLTASVALWRLWQQHDYSLPAWCAGHSLGEYSALVCAQAFELKDAVKLVALRGKLMQEAVPAGVGAMAAVLGLDNAILNEVCQVASQNEVVAPVNFNAIGQTVIAGNVAAVERASALAKEKGAKKIIPLPVSVPSHCALMKGAAAELGKALEFVRIQSPSIPVIHNVNVNYSSHPDDIRHALVEQLYSPVRWVETIERLAQEGVNVVVECGPGKVLSGLIKRITPSVQAYALESTTEWDNTAHHIL